MLINNIMFDCDHGKGGVDYVIGRNSTHCKKYEKIFLNRMQNILLM